MNAASNHRFQHFDPRSDVTYTANSPEEMIQKAEQHGFSSFAEIDHGGRIVDRHVKVGNDWLLASELDRRNAAASRVEAFVRRVENGLAQSAVVSNQTPAERAGVEQACREFGTTVEAEAERRAASGIETRSLAYSTIALDAKHAKLAALRDITARLQEINKPEPNVVPQEVSRRWATLDFQDYTRLQTPERQEEAAIYIAENMRANADYRQALEITAPDLVTAVRGLNAENDRKVAEKARIEAQELVPMASMPGHFMTYCDTPGMAGAEIHTPDGRIISFGGKPAIEKFAEQTNLAPEDKQKLLDLESLADRYRGNFHSFHPADWEPYPDSHSQLGRVFPAYEGSDLTQPQQDALDAFRAKNGFRWKSRLRECWMKSNYPGMTMNQSASLQQIRNNLGPEWLVKYQSPDSFAARVTGKLLDKVSGATKDNHEVAKKVGQSFSI